jgi:hypothetical protein
MDASHAKTANSSPPSRARTSELRNVSSKTSAVRDQRQVSLAVSEGIVDALEIVDIEIEEQNALFITTREFQLPRNGRQKTTTIKETGEIEWPVSELRDRATADCRHLGERVDRSLILALFENIDEDSPRP